MFFYAPGLSQLNKDLECNIVGTDNFLDFHYSLRPICHPSEHLSEEPRGSSFCRDPLLKPAADPFFDDAPATYSLSIAFHAETKTAFNVDHNGIFSYISLKDFECHSRPHGIRLSTHLAPTASVWSRGFNHELP